MAGAAKKSAKIIKRIWSNAPKAVKCTEGAVIVSMAAAVLTAPVIDECSKAAVQDMAHELCYTWDPFVGDFA